MRFIETKISDHKETNYVDIDKAFKFSISMAKNNKFRVRAFFLTSQKSNKDNMIFPAYVELREFDKEKQAIIYLRKLLKGWLEEEE